MSQAQRIQSFDRYRKGESHILLATDLAGRGLDIQDVKYVVNFELPVELTRYIHRIGRTARAGRNGVSITICDDQEALRLKKMLRKTGDQVLKLNLAPEHMAASARLISQLEAQIHDIRKQEKEEMEIRKAEMEIQRMENMQDHELEIKQRPRREWVCSKREKILTKQRAKEKALQGDLSDPE